MKKLRQVIPNRLPLQWLSANRSLFRQWGMWKTKGRANTTLTRCAVLSIASLLSWASVISWAEQSGPPPGLLISPDQHFPKWKKGKRKQEKGRPSPHATKSCSDVWDYLVQKHHTLVTWLKFSLSDNFIKSHIWHLLDFSKNWNTHFMFLDIKSFGLQKLLLRTI